MRNLMFVLLISVSYLFSYNLLTGFLQPDNYTLEYGDDLLKNENWTALNLAVGLTSTDIDQAITQLYSQLSDVSGKPTINFSPTVNTSAQCKITYAPLSGYAIMECQTTENCGYTGFIIRVNTAIRDNASWNNQFGWNTHINLRSVLKHELGHALGLFENFEDEEVMMYEKQDVADVVTTIDLTPKIDDINGLKHVYEPPLIQVQNPYMLEGETYRVFYENESDEIEFRVTVPELHEYNSVIPPDIVPVGFFVTTDNYYYGDDASFTYLGNRTYSFTTNMKNLAAQLGASTMKLITYNERSGWIASDYNSYHSPCGEITFEIAPKPTIESPLPNETYHVRPTGGKGSVTDTLAIKVRVPEILGSYPQINIKIDDVYVNQGDITFDSGENVWVYNWDLSAEAPTEYGKRYSIKAEIDGDPTDFDVTSIYLVEPIFFEDFQSMTDMYAEGWTTYSYEYPGLVYIGWWLDVDALDYDNKCAVSVTTHSPYLTYWISNPAFTVPSDLNRITKVTYRLFYAEIQPPPNSTLYFSIRDLSGNPLNTQNIPVAAVKDQWIYVTYDLTEFAGQTIKLRWNNYYNSGSNCQDTAFCLDDVMIYTLPDMSGPLIDFIAGNTADINEDMNLTLQFNDNSDISSVTADYSIEEDSDTITLYPAKGTYNYTGTISARDHECLGSISFKIKDSVGNETVSSLYSINWVAGGGYVLSAPENVLIATENDSTAVLTWDLVPGATGYKVYSSLDPYGTFAEDSTGTFTESRKWEKAFDGDKYFYYIIATDAASKETKRILAPRRTEVK